MKIIVEECDRRCGIKPGTYEAELAKSDMFFDHIRGTSTLEIKAMVHQARGMTATQMMEVQERQNRAVPVDPRRFYNKACRFPLQDYAHVPRREGAVVPMDRIPDYDGEEIELEYVDPPKGSYHPATIGMVEAAIRSAICPSMPIDEEFDDPDKWVPKIEHLLCPECHGSGKYESPVTGKVSPCSLGCFA